MRKLSSLSRWAKAPHSAYAGGEGFVLIRTCAEPFVCALPELQTTIGDQKKERHVSWRDRTNLGSGGENMYANRSRVWVSIVIGWADGTGPCCGKCDPKD